MRWLLVFLVLPLMAADDPPVKLAGGNTLQLPGDSGARVVRAAVATGSFTVKKGERPEVIEVSLNNVRDEAWTKWFTARWDPDTGKPAALVIVVTKELARAGTYNVVLQLRPALPRLSLQIAQAAAQLEVPDKLLINRTQNWPFACCEPDTFAFDARETGGQASVTDLEFFNRQATQGTEAVSGTITLRDKPSIAAGHKATLDLELKGEYPRGTVTGSLKILAPELAQPVALPYEVRTRLHVTYLFLAILAGLLVSYWVRTVLQKRIELAQAQLQAQEIIDDVADHARNYDQTLRDAIEPQRAALEQARQGDDPQAITDAATALRTAWTDAVKEFNARSARAGDALRDLQGVVAVNWVVPASVAATVAAARTACAAAKTAIEQRQPDTAEAGLATARRDMAQDLRTEGLAWQNAARGLGNAIANATLGIPEAVRAEFASAWQQSAPELSRITNDAIPAEAPALRRALEDLQNELRQFTGLMTSLKAQLQFEWGAVATLWQPFSAGLPRADLLQQLSVDFLQMAADLGSSASNPGPVLDGLAARLTALHQQWRDAIVAQVPADYAHMADLETAIQNRQFQLAMHAAIAAHRHLQFAWGGEGFNPAASPWPGGVPPRGDSPFTTIFGFGAPGAAPVLSRVRFQHSLRQAQILQTLVVGALTALWTFTSYKETWDGTWVGLLAPLLGAFLLDVSVEGLKNQVKEKKG